MKESSFDPEDFLDLQPVRVAVPAPRADLRAAPPPVAAPIQTPAATPSLPELVQPPVYVRQGDRWVQCESRPQPARAAPPISRQPLPPVAPPPPAAEPMFQHRLAEPPRAAASATPPHRAPSADYPRLQPVPVAPANRPAPPMSAARDRLVRQEALSLRAPQEVWPEPPVAQPVPQPVAQVSEPLVVRWQGQEHPTRNWSALGFTLEVPFDAAAGPVNGRALAVALLIGHGTTRLEMRVRAQSVTVDDPQPTRFAFVGLERDQADLLNAIAEHLSALEAVDVPHLFPPRAVADVPVAPPPMAPQPAAAKPVAPEPVAPAAPRNALRRFAARVRFGLTLAVLAAIGIVGWDMATTMESRLGAVTIAGAGFVAPGSGTVMRLDLQPGMVLRQGEAVGSLLPDGAFDASTALSLVSPCDCTVLSREVQVGDRVTAGASLALLSGDAAPVIHALIADNGQVIQAGARARVSLSDGTRVNGTVGRMMRGAQWPGQIGLQPGVFAADRYLRVEITPDAPLRAPVGTSAVARLQPNPWLAWLRGRLGL